jgi:paraquat-inducible protein B
MAQEVESQASTARPIVRPTRRLSPIWIIPIIAALLGAWLAWQYYASRGPAITVRFETADGIAAGKTPIMCRSVNVGTVENVSLTND